MDMWYACFRLNIVGYARLYSMVVVWTSQTSFAKWQGPQIVNRIEPDSVDLSYHISPNLQKLVRMDYRITPHNWTRPGVITALTLQTLQRWTEILQYMCEKDNPGLRDGTKRGNENTAGGEEENPIIRRWKSEDMSRRTQENGPQRAMEIRCGRICRMKPRDFDDQGFILGHFRNQPFLFRIHFLPRQIGVGIKKK